MAPLIPPKRPPRTVRKDVAGTQGAGRFDALLRSAYADSLEQLTGRPSVYTYGLPPAEANAGLRDPSQGTVFGQYVFHAARGQPSKMGADTLTLSPKLLDNSPLGGAPLPSSAQRTAPQPEYVLAHELGHRSRIMAGMVNGGPGGSAVRQEQDSTLAAADVSGRSTADPHAYWPENAHEHQAEAFANGVQFLRATARERADPDTPTRVQSLAATYERAVPGTQLMVQRLLQHPLYAHHPLYQALLPQRAAADATAVTPTPRAP